VSETGVIHTPDQRLRVFVSSTLQELAAERRAVQDAVTRLRLLPVMFELGARPHPPREVYRSYLAQSQVFVGVYWQSYGWVAPAEQVSGLEDEYRLSAGLPRLIYIKSPAPDRDPRLAQMLAGITDESGLSYRQFSEPAELRQLVENDLAVLLSERFEMTQPGTGVGAADEAPLAGAVPVPATPLLGREEEAAAVKKLVVGGGARLVTLTGPGGVGKSRLMLEATRRLGPGFADGARYLGLASVSAADLVAPAIAAGLGLNTSASRLITDLESYLRPRRLLLALDNFEQVMGAAPLLAELLEAAAGLVLLVTSRTVLRLRGEHEFPVPPLPVPPPGVGRDPADLNGYSSVGLFVDRAHSVDSGFELTSANAGAVAEICSRLDGLPLAIELAAARVRLLPPQALAARLDQRFSVLTGGARDLPERQRTLENTLGWSFDLLSAGEQTLLARLSVFAGPFSLAAAEAIGASDEGGASGPEPVIETLGSLVDSSLVRAENRDDEPRFSLLETIRDYALERLAGGGDWAAAHDRHAAYYQALTEPSDAELAGPGQLAWLRRLDPKHDNAWAAMSWLTDQGHPDQAVHMFLMTWRFWWLRGHLAEFARLGDAMAARSEGRPPYQRALALTANGFILLANGDPARAQTVFEQSLPLYRQTSEKLGVINNATVLAVLAHLAATRRDFTGASKLLDEGQVLVREFRDEDLAGYDRLQQLLTLAFMDNFLGQVRLSQADNDAAAGLFTDAMAVARRARDRIPVLVSLYDLALSSQAQGDLAGAAGHLKEGLAVAAEAGDETSAAYYLEALAAVAAQQDNPQRATRLLSAASSQLEANGSGWLHAYAPRSPHGDAVLAALRARLGDAAYQEARVWGRTVESGRARQYALE
jgi:predicted ATPase